MEVACNERQHMTNMQQNSIQCDRCFSCWNSGCVNITNENDEALEMDWFCDICKASITFQFLTCAHQWWAVVNYL